MLLPAEAVPREWQTQLLSSGAFFTPRSLQAGLTVSQERIGEDIKVVFRCAAPPRYHVLHYAAAQLDV